MNARQLEIFHAIMRYGTLTAAAESLNVSQPAVSKALRYFENQIGYALFERVGGRLVPTAEAQLLIGDADRILRELEVLQSFSDRIRDKQLGLLRVAASAPATFALLPAAAERFLQRNPGVRLNFETLSAEEISRRIVLGDIDLGLTMVALDQFNIHSEAIGTAEIVALMHPDSPLAALDRVSPADLQRETLISYDSKTYAGQKLDRTFNATGFERKPQIEITLSIAAAPLVQRGLGVAVVDRLVPWESLGGLVVRPFEPRTTLEIVVVTNSNLPKSRFLREFASDLEAAVSELG